MQEIEKKLYLLHNKEIYLNGETSQIPIAMHNIERVLREEIIDKSSKTHKMHEYETINSLSKFDFASLASLLATDMTNPVFMKNVSHFFHHLIEATINLENGNDILTCLINQSDVISEGVDGITARQNLLNWMDVLVLKSTKDESHDLLHEAVVGLWCLNNIRVHTPIFAYIYATVPCIGTFRIGDKELSWCNMKNGQVYSYLMMENITNSITLEDSIINGMGGKQFKLFYKAIIYGLKTANREYGFEHQDLHSKNVLVQTLDQDIEVPISADESFRGRVIPRIIDYGRSSFDFMGMRLEPQEFVREKHVLSDAYKLLMFSADAALRSGNKSVMRAARELYSFFDTGLIESRIQAFASNPLDYYLYINPMDGRSYDDLEFFLTGTKEIPEDIVVIGGYLDFLEEMSSSDSNSDPILFIIQKEYGIKRIAVKPTSIKNKIRDVFNSDYSIISEIDLMIDFQKIKEGWIYYNIALSFTGNDPIFAAETEMFHKILVEQTEIWKLKFNL